MSPTVLRSRKGARRGNIAAASSDIYGTAYLFHLGHLDVV